MEQVYWKRDTACGIGGDQTEKTDKTHNKTHKAQRSVRESSNVTLLKETNGFPTLEDQEFRDMTVTRRPASLYFSKGQSAPEKTQGAKARKNKQD